MIFDSGLNDIQSDFFKLNYLSLIEDIIKSFPNKIGYYFKGKELNDFSIIFNTSLAGIGINNTIT